MTLAAPSSFRAEKSRPRNSRSGPWRGILKISAGGLAIVVAGCVVTVAAMTGLGWLVAVSPAARTEFRPVVRATPLDRQASAQTWVQAWAQGRVQDRAQDRAREEPANRLAAVGGLRLPPATFRLHMPVADPLGALARIAPEPSETADDRIVTASIAPYVPRRVALEIITRRPDAAEPAPQPLPRARPKLASLGPVDGITLKPDADDALRRRTAIYDITAKTVYLPNGERLEAHSGLGEMMDDPQYKHVKMRGVTPPNTYHLTLRESLFHGVQAIRLNPVDEKAMFGRAGILAHSYLLGPNGQSNGCISFRDYPRFLSAFMRGEIDRIVVVVRLDKPPVFVDRAKVRGAATAL
jgi:hypothetical protein